MLHSLSAAQLKETAILSSMDPFLCTNRLFDDINPESTNRPQFQWKLQLSAEKQIMIIGKDGNRKTYFSISAGYADKNFMRRNKPNPSATSQF
jgi:hypothetical protein